MLFNSYTFIVFLLVVVVAHNALISSWSWQKNFLLLASYVFYAVWNPAFIVLIWVSTLTDWFVARWMYRAGTPGVKRLFLILSLSTNFGLLAFFKYGEFFLENTVALLAAVGVSYQPPEWSIVLPVGISFYTFQSLSYTLDVYRGKLNPRYSLRDFALYVTFFPQLVAGPIVRASYFLPQCLTPRRATSQQLYWGSGLVVLGLFAKVVLADAFLAPAVDLVYGDPKTYGPLAIWTAVFAFSGQIFFDFSGYSSCAIGCGLCLGFALPDNFRFPYAAAGFADFWRRWHISLSTWLRDYLYISLGGSRGSRRQTQINLMLTMFLGGLWHGSSWLFVLWGGLHGLYLVLERGCRERLQALDHAAWFRTSYILFTFLVVSITWVLFRSPAMAEALAVFSGLLGLHSGSHLQIEQYAVVAIVIPCMVGWQFSMRDKDLESRVAKMHWLRRAVLLAAMLSGIIVCAGGDERAFIYFQF